MFSDETVRLYAKLLYDSIVVWQLALTKHLSAYQWSVSWIVITEFLCFIVREHSRILMQWRVVREIQRCFADSLRQLILYKLWNNLCVHCTSCCVMNLQFRILQFDWIKLKKAQLYLSLHASIICSTLWDACFDGEFSWTLNWKKDTFSLMI